MTTAQPTRPFGGWAGFGLIEVVLAVMVSSIGVLAAASVTLAIGGQTRIARWNTDQALAARTELEATRRTGFTAAYSGSGTVGQGGRRLAFTTRVTTINPRLKQVRLALASPLGRQSAAFETRIAFVRPLPVAP